MIPQPPPSSLTVLGGALLRDPDGGPRSWRWRSGAPAEQVYDLTLRDCAPNFRCATFGGQAYVEIPRRWRSAGQWPRGIVDEDAAAAIERLLASVGRSSRIYAEGLAELRDDHRLTREGYLVPIAEWDAAMTQPCGASWDLAHQEAILARAQIEAAL